MDAILAARQLGRAIQRDSRYLRVMRAQAENDGDAALQEDIGAFNALREDLNAEVQKKEKDTVRIKEMDAELKAMYGRIFENEHMKEFAAAREEFQQMLTFVNQIINGAASGRDPDGIEFQEACGGDCGGCAGCG